MNSEDEDVACVIADIELALLSGIEDLLKISKYMEKERNE